jgi:hypothetical protein
MPEARLERTRRSYMNEYGLGRNYWQRLRDNLDMRSEREHGLPETPEWLMRDFERTIARSMRGIDAVLKPMK